MRSHRILCCNEAMTAGDEPGDIVAPYGVYRYGTSRCDDGRIHEVLQVWDRAAAERVAADLPPEGIPVYAGHPDVPELAAKYPDKGAKGWILAVEPGEDGCVFRVQWIDRPASGAFKWHSPYWLGAMGAPEADGTVRMAIGRILSIGLVNNPRIPDFAFACEAQDVTNPNQGARMDPKKLAALLGLPEDAGEEQIMEAITRLQTTAETADAANTDLEAAKAETEEEKKKCGAAETALANERSAHTELLLANALADGRLTPAGLPAWRDRLNRDFARYAKALANERPAVSTASLLAGRADGATGKSCKALANEIAEAEGISFEAAWSKAKAAHPDRFRGTAATK